MTRIIAFFKKAIASRQRKQFNHGYDTTVGALLRGEVEPEIVELNYFSPCVIRRAGGEHYWSGVYAGLQKLRDINVIQIEAE